MPFSSGIPSLVDQLRLEEAAKLSAARPGEETSKKTEEEEASRQKQLQQSGAAEEQLEAAKEKEQLDAAKKEKKRLNAAKKKEKERLEAAKKKKKGKEQVDASKERERQLVVAKRKAQQREAAKQVEQLKVAKETEQLAPSAVDQTLNTKKRSAEETDAAALEAVIAKKAKVAKDVSLSHAKEGVPLSENPRLCADWCKGVSSSTERLPEFKEMDEEEVYEEYARSSIQAMTAANELFGRLKRSLSRSKTAQSQEAQMKEAMSNAKTAYRKEHERAKFFEEELAKMRADRDSVVGELEKVKAEFKDAHLQAAHNERTLNDEINLLKDELDLSHEREKNMGVELERRKAEFSQAYKDEQRRLRESREIQVNAERQVNSQLRERCQARFDKIKSHLEKRKESEAVVGLHAQAKGVREVLEYMKSLKTIDVPDSLIADFAGREAKYLARCNAVEEVELLPSDLEVPYGVESTPLEAEAGVVAHRSNEELIDAMVAGELREPTAPGNELADVDAGKE